MTEIDRKLFIHGVHALLGSVPQSLRFVSIELIGEIINWKCVFDKNANDYDIELLSVAATELAASFPNYGLNEISVIIEYPKPSKNLKNLIYYRHENYYDKNGLFSS